MCANEVLSYFIPSPTSKGIRKYDTLFKHTQPPLSYSCLLQGLMEEQNLYVLHILNWQYCVNICGNNNNNINDVIIFISWFLNLIKGTGKIFRGYNPDIMVIFLFFQYLYTDLIVIL